MAKPGELVMFTSEIGCVELNTLRDEMVLIIPAEFEVTFELPDGVDGKTELTLVRRAE